MHMLYDTTKIGAPDRFNHYRAGCLSELVPIEIDGPIPRRLLATMSVSQIGEFEVERFDWTADSDVVVRRTERLIRVGGPECYRPILTIAGEVRLDQGDAIWAAGRA